MKHIIGLDIGIGSVGWAVLNAEEPRRIEDFGVRIFESGESNGGKDRTSQERRGFRSSRRLIRRRSHRRHRLKAHLYNIGLTNEKALNKYYEICSPDILSTRLKGLDEKLSGEEIAACLVHICKRRGYKDFYEVDKSSFSKEEVKEYESERQGADLINEIMSGKKYRSVAEMYLLDPVFDNDSNSFRKYRNSNYNDTTNLVSRKMLEKEVELILENQSKYYSNLNKNNIDVIKDIIFKQRDFEDGPGNPNDPYRRYKGFLDTIGKCRFYQDEIRGSRFTVLADIYSLVNVLSQYTYVNSDNEPALSKELAQDLIGFALKNGKIYKRDVKKIVKEHKITVSMKDSEKGDSLSNCIKYIKVVKKLFEDDGFDWESLISGDYCDNESYLLNIVGAVLSKFQTPSRRKAELKKIGALSDSMIEKLSNRKFSGTCAVCNRYMKDAVDAFLEGDIYGNFQAETIKTMKVDGVSLRLKKLPAFDKSFEFYKNPVVFRSINETRKIINAIVEKYGSPCAINIEVASELNKCSEDRDRDSKRQARNQKNRETTVSKIAELLEISEDEVTPVMVEKHRLGEQQGWKCLYSGKVIDKDRCLSKTSREYEIDHIVPFSLILDNTIHNKALVYTDENRAKSQQIPLMYMSTDKADGFKARVNVMKKDGIISRKKYEYLMLENLNNKKLDEWKSRNLNDTRYIAKFLVNYLENTLEFAQDGKEFYRTSNVYGVKGAITSRFRRLWLNDKTWGVFDKSELKKLTYLDHAVDAVVIASCLPAYVIIASENIKLRNIYKKAGKSYTTEYHESKRTCIETLQKFYQMKRSEIEPLLSNISKVPSFISNLREEVDIRFTDPDIYRHFNAKEDGKDFTDEEVESIFKDRVKELYFNDLDFANSLEMPLTSHKQTKKASGKVTTSNPISIKEIDGVNYQMSKKSVKLLKKSEVQKIHTNDTDLINSLNSMFEGSSDSTPLEKVLKDKNLDYFTTNKGQTIKKVTLKKAAPAAYLVKTISEDNKTVLNDRSYYCIELYHDKNQKLHARAIPYSHLVKKDGKLYLNERHTYPKVYDCHVMYWFKNDYLIIKKKKGEIKFEGFYKSVFNINQGCFYCSRHNSPLNSKKPFSLARTDTVTKHYVDIMGRRGGEIKCGEPLLSTTAKE